ncbi:MAG: response regulator transcription factor [Treponema sp.]|nr:response regulator transcription factor [Treponema sp.]
MDVTNIVLIVDDEKMIRDAVSAYFTKMGWRTFEADNGQDALALFEKTPISFVILDLMLPGMSGEDVCREIRKKSRIPIIMLTAKTQEESILNGLHIGADDYVTKPFSVKQLYARMEAVMRRASDERKALTGLLSWEDDLVIDFEEASARKKGAPLSLTKSEWKILSAMASYPKKVFTRDELMEIAFGGDADSFDRVIDTHIKNLRKKVESDPRNPVYIKTVHGLGYKFGGDEN